MWDFVAGFILRYRIYLLIVIGLITGYMAFLSKELKPTYKSVPPLPNDDIAIVEYNRFLDHFGTDSDVLVLGYKDSSFYEYSNLKEWVKLIGKLEAIKGVESALSLSEAVELRKDTANERFRLEQIVDATNEISKSDIDDWISRFFQNPLYEKLLHNGKDGAGLAGIKLDQKVLVTEDRERLIHEIVQEVEKYSAKTEVKIHYSGLPYLRTINAIKVKGEIGLFIALAMAVTSIIMFLFFRSLTATLFSMLVVGIGVAWSMGSMVLLGYDITILTALIPPLIIVIGIPNCVFLLNKYHHEYKTHGNKVRALNRVIQKVGRASLMTNMTTAAGFATFALTNSKILVEFGIVAAINIILVFVISLIVIPSIYSGLNPPKAKHLRHLKRKWMNNVIEWMVRIVQTKRQIIYIITSVLVVFAFIGISKIETSGSLTDDIPKDDPLYLDLKFFEDEFRGIIPFEILIDTKKPNGVSKLGTLKKIERLQKELYEEKGYSSPISVVNFLKFSKQAFYNGNPKFYELPNSMDKAWILSYLKNSKIEGGGQNPLKSHVDSTGQIARISLAMPDVGIQEMNRIKEDIRGSVESIFNPDKYDVSFTGASVIFLKGTTYLVNNLFVSLGLAIVVISILMAWMFSSGRMVMVSLLPNLIPLIFTGALMGYFGIVIKPSTILVFSIAFGISIDDTIHFLAKYRQELKSNGWNIKSAVLAGIRETGVSMIYTSIVLFFGFSIFVASDFGGTVALGLLVSVTLLIAMVANLILLPGLLLSLERWITTKAFSEPFVDILDEEEDIELEALRVKTIPKEKTE